MASVVKENNFRKCVVCGAAFKLPRKDSKQQTCSYACRGRKTRTFSDGAIEDIINLRQSGYKWSEIELPAGVFATTAQRAVWVYLAENGRLTYENVASIFISADSENHKASIVWLLRSTGIAPSKSGVPVRADEDTYREIHYLVRDGGRAAFHSQPDKCEKKELGQGRSRSRRGGAR